jgi:hypothetical protein
MALVAMIPGCDPALLRVQASAPVVRAGVATSIQLEAQAAELELVVLEYGDGHADTTAAAGAERVSGTFLHTYQRPGSYVVRVDAVRSSGRRTSRQLHILVKPGDRERSPIS